MAEVTFPHHVVAVIKDPIGPVDRGAKYADPLDQTLKSAGLGEVSGAGSQLDASGRIAFVDIEVAVSDLEGSVELLRQTLKQLGAPSGSSVSFERGGKPISLSIESGHPVDDAQAGHAALSRRLLGSGDGVGITSSYDPDLIRKTAARMLASYRSLFVDGYQYGPIDRAAYEPELFAWYDEQTAHLSSLGFSALGDWKIIKDASRPEPGGAFARKFMAADGRNRGDIFQIKSATPGAWVRVINLVAEFDNGHFLVSTTAPQRWNAPDHATIASAPPDTPVAELLTRHVERLTDYLAKNPGVQVVRLSSLQDVLDSENRSQAATGRFRRSQGIPSVEELLRLGSEKALAVLVHEAMRRTLSGDTGRPERAGETGRWHVAAADLPLSRGKPMSFGALIDFALDQGIKQVQAAGSPLNPFLVLDSGRTFFFVCEEGDGDPMQIALQTLRREGAGAASCALVMDTRITVKGASKCDAIMVMASRRQSADGETWAQGYRPKGLLRSFKVLPLRERLATSKSLFAAADEAAG